MPIKFAMAVRLAAICKICRLEAEMDTKGVSAPMRTTSSSDGPNILIAVHTRGAQNADES